ncbi:MAG: biopolymer transporter ExbD [Candidatus Obscuribacterales bacterium]|nr:biopolymer transporter ExbD [Candidatus Obscuribacterales bacterium]
MSMGGKAGETFTEINVTPLTDVFLVLLVIMILVAPLVNQAVLKVSPPGISTQQDPKDANKPKVEANVTADGSISINGNAINPPDTKSIMNAIRAEQAKNPEEALPLILASDEDALQKHVVSVMDAATGCDIKNMVILPPRPSGK